MLAKLNSLNIFQTTLMLLVSQLMVHRALSDKRYLSLGLLSPLKCHRKISRTCSANFSVLL